MRHEDRAKQFMPFAALKGYEELIEEQSEQPIKPSRGRRFCAKTEHFTKTAAPDPSGEHPD